MNDQSPIDNVGSAIFIARMLLCRLSDAHYTAHRGFHAADVLLYLNAAEKECVDVLSRINEARDQVAAVAVIDRMASVSCGD